MNTLNQVSFTASTAWVKENDSNLFHYLSDIMDEFVRDEVNSCDEQDLEDFESGNWQVEYLFRDGEVIYTAGRDGQHIANQDGWTRDQISDLEPAQVELYKSMI